MDNLANLSWLAAATLWWVGAGLLVAAELLVGTFYLLMMALGLAAAAIAAHLSAGVPAQIALAVLVGCGAVAALYARRRRYPRPKAAKNRDVNIDIGNVVDVVFWSPDGRTRLDYRGASWEARYEGPGHPAPGRYTIRALDGNVLVLGH